MFKKRLQIWLLPAILLAVGVCQLASAQEAGEPIQDGTCVLELSLPEGQRR